MAEYNTEQKKLLLEFLEKNHDSAYTIEEIAQELSKRGIATRGGYHCSLIAHKTLNTENVGAVRLSPSVFNNKNEMQFVLNEVDCVETRCFTIRNKDYSYTEEYREFLKDYYLDF